MASVVSALADEGVIVLRYRYATLGGSVTSYAACDYHGNLLNLGTKEKTMLERKGFPFTIHNEQAYYHANASTRFIERVTLDSDVANKALQVFGSVETAKWVTTNDQNSHFFYVWAFQVAGITTFSLQRRPLPIVADLTGSDGNRVGIEQGQPHQAHRLLRDTIWRDYERAGHREVRLFPTDDVTYMWFFQRTPSGSRGLAHLYALFNSGVDEHFFAHRIGQATAYSPRFIDTPDTFAAAANQYFLRNGNNLHRGWGTTPINMGSAGQFITELFTAAETRNSFNNIKILATRWHIWAHCGSGLLRRWNHNARAPDSTKVTFDFLPAGSQILDFRWYNPENYDLGRPPTVLPMDSTPIGTSNAGISNAPQTGGGQDVQPQLLPAGEWASPANNHRLSELKDLRLEFDVPSNRRPIRYVISRRPADSNDDAWQNLQYHASGNDGRWSWGNEHFAWGVTPGDRYFVIPRRVWGQADNIYEFSYAYGDEITNEWSHFSSDLHIICERDKPPRPTWVNDELTRQASPTNYLFLDFYTTRNVDEVKIRRRRTGTTTWLDWSYDSSSRTTGWFRDKERWWSMPRRWRHAYQLPAGKWGTAGSVYEFQVAYTDRDSGEASAWSVSQTITALVPPAPPAQITAPPATTGIPPDGLPRDGDNPETFTVAIPSGQTARRVRLLRTTSDGQQEEWWDDTIDDWSPTRAWATPVGSYTGDVDIVLPADWQEPETTRTYYASYTTGLAVAAYGDGVFITTDAAPIVLPPAPRISYPADGSEHDPHRTIVFEVDIPVGEVAEYLQLRREDTSSPVRHAYWEGRLGAIGWTNVPDADATTQASPSPALYSGTPFIRIDPTITSSEGTTYWQLPGSTKPYEVRYRSINGLDSSWSAPVSVTALEFSPSAAPTITAPVNGTRHAPEGSLEVTISLPAGEIGSGVYLQRRVPGSSSVQHRNSANTDWVDGEADDDDAIIVPLSQDELSVTLPSGWQGADDVMEYEAAYRDTSALRSLFSTPISIGTLPGAHTRGMVIYELAGTGGWGAIDYDGNDVALSPRMLTLLQSRGLPAFIYGDEAYYVDATFSVRRVNAYNVITNTSRVAWQGSGDVEGNRLLTINDTGTKAYQLVRSRVGGVLRSTLVEYDLPNFTGARNVEVGLASQGGVDGSRYVTNLHTVNAVRRDLVVSDNWAYLRWYAVPLSGSNTHLFSNSIYNTLTVSSTVGRKTYTATNDHYYAAHSSARTIERIAAGNAQSTAETVASWPSGISTLYVTSTRWHIWGFATNRRDLYRWDVDGSSSQTIEVSSTDSVRQAEAYRPHNYSYTSVVPLAPVWLAPADGSEHDPGSTLLLDWANGGVASDGVIIQRRLYEAQQGAEDGWLYWGVAGESIDDWVGEHTVRPYQSGLVSAYRLPVAWGVDGREYEFRVRWRATDTQLLSDWSAPRRVIAEAPVPTSVVAPRITSPASGSTHDPTLPLVVEVLLPTGIATNRVYLRRDREGSLDADYWDEAQQAWSHNVSAALFDADDGLTPPLVGLVRIELPGEWQAAATTREYEAGYHWEEGDELSPFSSPPTFISASGGVDTDPRAPVVVRQTTGVLEERTPHAPTWAHPLRLARGSALQTTFNWTRNPRYSGQQQTAYRVRRQAKDGSAAQYLTAAGGWENASQSITSADEFVTLNPTWQAAGTVRDYFVRVRDEGGRWSTYSAALEVDTTTEAVPREVGFHTLADIRITSPTHRQTVGQYPVVTWDADEAIAYQMRTRRNIHFGPPTSTLWTGDWVLGVGRGTAYFPNVSSFTVTDSIQVRVRDNLGRTSRWASREVVVEFTPRTAPEIRVIRTTAAAILTGLVTADPDVVSCVIERRIVPAARAAAAALGVPPDELEAEVVVFRLDHAPVATAPTAVEDYAVRHGVDYEYRYILRWNDETGLTTGWEDGSA